MSTNPTSACRLSFAAHSQRELPSFSHKSGHRSSRECLLHAGRSLCQSSADRELQEGRLSAETMRSKSGAALRLAHQQRDYIRNSSWRNTSAYNGLSRRASFAGGFSSPPLRGFKAVTSLQTPAPRTFRGIRSAVWQPHQQDTLSQGRRASKPQYPVTSSAGRGTMAAPPVASAQKPKDMYADLARYGIMDEFDMAPLPYYASSSTMAHPAPPPPGSPAALPKAPPGRPRRGTVEIDPVPGNRGSSSSDEGEGFVSELALRSAHAKTKEAEDGAGAKGAQGFEEAAPGTWCVYLLLAADERKTYVGVTNDVERRLKQHNGDLVGGAKTTKAGRPWSLICSVSGFQTRSEAFQFEWRWKNPRAVKGDGSFDRNSMAPSAQLLRESEAAAEAAAAGSAPVAPLVVERRRAALDEALRTFPKWRYLQVTWAESVRR